jgi:hypothetical protein
MATCRWKQTMPRCRSRRRNWPTWLGVSRRTVSEELGRLKKEGMVASASYRRLALRDVPALLRIACEEWEARGVARVASAQPTRCTGGGVQLCSTISLPGR